MTGARGPVTVSTLREAEYFFSHGVSDLLYAVSIAPNKLDHVFDLRRRGADLEPGRVQQRTLVQNQSIIWNSIYE
jgi:D-serine deaminase-like pyridoxal phosphate-dependent protein